MAETRGRRVNTGRIESFSDAVLAIVLTLLVLDLVPHSVLPPQQYLDDWPKYLAYLTAFLTVGSVWINHHALFTRIQRADGAVFILNLLILLGTSLVPWPTAAIGLALGGRDHDAQVAADALYAVVILAICVPWTALDHHLAKRPHLAVATEDQQWLNRHAVYTSGFGVGALAAAGIAFWSPLVALCIYLATVLAFVAARTRETRTD